MNVVNTDSSCVFMSLSSSFSSRSSKHPSSSALASSAVHLEQGLPDKQLQTCATSVSAGSLSLRMPIEE